MTNKDHTLRSNVGVRNWHVEEKYKVKEWYSYIYGKVTKVVEVGGLTHIHTYIHTQTRIREGKTEKEMYV